MKILVSITDSDIIRHYVTANVRRKIRLEWLLYICLIVALYLAL